VNIAVGDELFYILGFRKYYRLYVDSSLGEDSEGKMISYIPKGGLERQMKKVRKLIRPMDPKWFCDPIHQHRMCKECLKKLCNLFGRNANRFFMEDKNMKFHFPSFSMAYALLENSRMKQCKCCSDSVQGSMEYLKVGHGNAVCLNCAEIMTGFLGTEYSD
jgi:hypothetical protein